jgi:hypothetical protein
MEGKWSPPPLHASARSEILDRHPARTAPSAGPIRLWIAPGPLYPTASLKLPQRGVGIAEVEHSERIPNRLEDKDRRTILMTHSTVLLPVTGIVWNQMCFDLLFFWLHDETDTA